MKLLSEYLVKLTANMSKVCSAVILLLQQKQSLKDRLNFFSSKIIISYHVNVMNIFSIHLETHLINELKGAFMENIKLFRWPGTFKW